MEVHIIRVTVPGFATREERGERLREVHEEHHDYVEACPACIEERDTGHRCASCGDLRAPDPEDCDPSFRGLCGGCAAESYADMTEER
jgi:hypothetical protein